jgi:hypothetical protein
VLCVHVNEYYTFDNERVFLSNNLVPVCIKRVDFDGNILPPKQMTKRTTGRPKTVRLRKRSRLAYEPIKSNIMCSRGRQRGHNVRKLLCEGSIGRPRIRHRQQPRAGSLVKD